MTISLQSAQKTRKKIIPALIREYYPLFRAEKTGVSQKDLSLLANSAFEKATAHFIRLKSPKTCRSLSVFATFWLREEFDKFLQAKTIRKVKLQKTERKGDKYSKAVSNLFSILPLDLLAPMNQRLFAPDSFKQRKKIFKEYKPILNELKRPFEDMVCWRNALAKKKEHSDYVSFIRQKDQIPTKEYNRFRQNIDEVINCCYRKLPKVKNLPDWFYDRLNQPCLLCLVSFEELVVPGEVLNFVAKLYPQLKLFIPKIQVGYGKKAYMRYIKENDSFKVIIQKRANHRHQMIDLVHELGHVIYFIDSFANNVDLKKRGKYVAEKEAQTVFLKVLSSFNPKILRAYYADLLLVIHRSLFELAIYDKPKQDYDLLYAQLFNKCFPCASQRRNSLYLIEESIVARPLISLPFVVASANLLLENFCNKKVY